jgi:hypothetical protein
VIEIDEVAAWHTYGSIENQEGKGQATSRVAIPTCSML